MQGDGFENTYFAWLHYPQKIGPTSSHRETHQPKYMFYFKKHTANMNLEIVYEIHTSKLQAIPHNLPLTMQLITDVSGVTKLL